ncbi:MAG: hypothetical protein LR000_00900 [Candidatus Pacebacteria bacterium]|nr:hypothetical protein [Candidatus Paceibacterota bacterium]
MEERQIFSINKREDPNYPAYFEEPLRPQRSKKPFLILGVVVALILAGLTGVLASRIWDPLWNPFRPSPEAVLLKAFEAHKGVQTYHSKIYLFLDAKQERGESFSFEAQIEGDSDLSDKDAPKSHMNFSFSVFVGPIKLPFSGQTITIGDVEYFKIDKLPFVGLFQLFTLFGEKMKMTEQEKAKIEMGKAIAIQQIGNQIIGKWIRISLDELGIGFGKPKEKKEALKKKAEELILKYPILKPKQEFKDKVINGERYYHYLLSVDKENLKQFLKEILPFVEEEKIYSRETAMLPQERKNFDVKIDEFFGQVGEVTTEIWISKKTYLVHRINGKKEFKDKKGEKNIAWDMVFSNYNQPVQILPPEESTSIMEIIRGLMGFFFQQPEASFWSQPTPIF